MADVNHFDMRRVAHEAALALRAADHKDAAELETRLRNLLFECEAALHIIRGGKINVR